MVKTIYTKKNEEILVDDEDFEMLSKYRWHLRKGYVTSSVRIGKDKIVAYRMHRLIMNAKDLEEVDHINNDKADNRKCNLRMCSRGENSRNRKINKRNKVGYKGVYKSGERFIVEVANNNSRVYSGSFSNDIAAANAYNYYAKHYHGDFAKLNDVPFMHREEWESYKFTKKTSKFRGVSRTNTGKWVSRATANGKVVRIGEFNSEIDAAIAYNKFVIEVMGQKEGKLNKSESGEVLV